jgi:hypothetical protein
MIVISCTIMASKDVKKACFHEILLRINTSDYTNKYQMKDYSIPTVSVILVEWTKSGAKKLLNFDEALLGWIIYTANQAFTCVESQYFKDLIQAAGRTTKLLHSVNLKGTTQSIDETATTVAVTLEVGRTKISMLLLALTLLGVVLISKSTCLDIVQITGSFLKSL